MWCLVALSGIVGRNWEEIVECIHYHWPKMRAGIPTFASGSPTFTKPFRVLAHAPSWVRGPNRGFHQRSSSEPAHRDHKHSVKSFVGGPLLDSPSPTTPLPRALLASNWSAVATAFAGVDNVQMPPVVVLSGSADIVATSGHVVAVRDAVAPLVARLLEMSRNGSADGPAGLVHGWELRRFAGLVALDRTDADTTELGGPDTRHGCEGEETRAHSDSLEVKC